MMDQRRHTADQMANHKAELANHQAELERKFAKEMSEMRAIVQAALTSKDTQLADAKVAIDKANAECRNAAGQVHAETAAMRAWQNKANEAHRALTELQAQRARDAEDAKSRIQSRGT